MSEVFNVDEWVKAQKELERKFEDGILFKDLPTVDTLTRHKWPEEKPDKQGEYLVRLLCGDKLVLPWHDGYFYLDDYLTIDYIDDENPITHWWELPEVE